MKKDSIIFIVMLMHKQFWDLLIFLVLLVRLVFVYSHSYILTLPIIVELLSF